MDFTWYDKFTRMAASIPDDAERLRFLDAVLAYGTYGTEPEPLGWPLDGLFEGFRSDIDNSHAFRESGRRGGRPRKKKETNDASAENNENPPLNPPLKQRKKEGRKEGKKEGHSSSYEEECVLDTHAREGVREGGFVAPTPDEVREYCAAHGRQVDAERLCDHYAQSGWLLANGNQIRDWRAAVRRWWQTDHPGESWSGGRPKQTKKSRDEELAELERRLGAERGDGDG